METFSALLVLCAGNSLLTNTLGMAMLADAFQILCAHSPEYMFELKNIVSKQ